MSERWVPFDVSQAAESPMDQWARWYSEGSAEVREPEAIALSTVDASGQPSTRMVLLRQFDERGFVWFTNYNSRKGRDLADNARAALLWYCEPLGRQVRIEGVVSQVSRAESDAYFASRPRGHQIGAHASYQSEPLPSRDELEQRVLELTQHFAGRDIPRPLHWGGFRLEPTLFEFWQHRSDRLHDRVIYAPSSSGWDRYRTSP